MNDTHNTCQGTEAMYTSELGEGGKRFPPRPPLGKKAGRGGSNLWPAHRGPRQEVHRIEPTVKGQRSLTNKEVKQE